jgi:molybdopterin/thiamine biosynthesis adenylyltransferase
LSFDRSFFSRQLVLKGFGIKGQRRLARSHALVAGLGGTGSVVALLLALAGVGRLTIVDRDVVALENLHRQPTYTLADVGMSKAEVTSRFLLDRAPGLRVDYHAVNIDSDNGARLVRGADIAVDCMDNFAGRSALNAACVRKRIPFVHSGSTGWEASCGIFWSPRTACFGCLFPDPQGEDLPTCEDVGALGALTTYVASLAALESVKLLARVDSGLLGAMLVFDGQKMESRMARFEKRRDCPVCGRTRSAGRPSRAIELCGNEEILVSRAFSTRSFERLAGRLGASASRKGDSILATKILGFDVSLFRTGNLLIRGTASREDVRLVAKELGLDLRL